MFFQRFLVELKAFLEGLGVKKGYEFRFKKEFGFAPPKKDEASSKKQTKIEAELIEAANRALDAHQRFIDSDVRFSFDTLGDDDFPQSSPCNYISPYLQERNRTRVKYRKMKDLAKNAGIDLSEDSILSELDDKINETELYFGT